MTPPDSQLEMMFEDSVNGGIDVDDDIDTSTFDYERHTSYDDGCYCPACVEREDFEG